MTRRRELLLGVVTVSISIAAFCIAAEVALQFTPVASGMRTMPVTLQEPVSHFTPNRDFVYSRDWDMVLANRGHVNNAGFVNDQDYRKDGGSPLLAVVGDSMIEAAMVPYRDTLHGRLAKLLDGKLRVYSFAAAGAPLSQYLIWARHAVREYGAQALIINVVSNDFDESHASHKTGPGFWHYVPDAKGELQLHLFEYRPGLLRTIVTSSALLRYLVFNLQLASSWEGIKRLFVQQTNAAPAPPAGSEHTRTRDSLDAIGSFFRDLPQYAGLPPSRILFVVDGFRIPSEAAAGSYFDVMRMALLEKAAALGYDAIDLDPFFFESFRRNGRRFDFPRDGHWSSIGHGVAVEAVMASLFLARLVPQRQSFLAVH